MDDPFVIAGQGTIGLEICEDLAAQGLVPDIVMIPASGGGMAADSVWHRSISAAIIERTNMSRSRTLSMATLLAAIALVSVAGAARAQSATEIQLTYDPPMPCTSTSGSPSPP